ncbi:deoxyribose-phosphate aldolase [candidate division TA06 bacterium SM23_40]|uniref:Deoxyribose-phosphate aldolase n=1 Tax=candidate division TA06 bacterium SM23_40 TaxID=1703774 RepID=A0A0S8G7M0_UNCT6|nr:MAG: deoxyribose-phosphate aldolase [candidate division TA06 bacterium SM23_40]
MTTAPGERIDLARLIDHTLLRADATQSDVERVCDEAIQWGFAAVCVNPWYVKLAKRELAGSSTKVCTVAGFPLGATLSAVKAHEAELAVSEGAQEIDMVMNLGALKSGLSDVVSDDIRAVVVSAGPSAIVKVIIEACYLTDEEKVLACRLIQESGADFVKTSTGFGTGGATVEDVRLMRRSVGPELGVKAAGGIADRRTALSLVEAGATRIGSSRSLAIVGEA